MANAFDKVAKKKSPSKKKDNIPVATNVNENMREQVDLIIKNRAQIRVLQEELNDAESGLIEYVRKQQDEMAWCGNYSKSFRVEGSTYEDDEGNEQTSRLTYVSADRFSVPQEPEEEGESDVDRLKKLCGDLFEEFFETKRTIKLDEDIVKDEKTLNKIADACKKAGLGLHIFDVIDELKAKKGLDEKQYKLSKTKLSQFRTLVRQNKPSFR